MITIDDIENQYNKWKEDELPLGVQVRFRLELDILKVRELKLIRMNLDRVNENLEGLGKLYAHDLKEG